MIQMCRKHELKKPEKNVNWSKTNSNKTLPTAVDYWGAHEQQALQGVSEII